VSAAIAPTSPASRALERLAWLGLLAGLTAAGAAAGAPRRPAVAYAAFGPQDLTAWVTAICGSIGALTAALNGLAIVVRRWGRPPRPRKPRPKGPDATPAPARPE
jgi:hypothetical protein